MQIGWSSPLKRKVPPLELNFVGERQRICTKESEGDLGMGRWDSAESEEDFTVEKQADKVFEVTFKAVRWRATVEYCSLLKSWNSSVKEKKYNFQSVAAQPLGSYIVYTT